MFSYEFCEIPKNTFFYRTPLVAASEKLNFFLKKMYSMKSLQTPKNYEKPNIIKEKILPYGNILIYNDNYKTDKSNETINDLIK